MAAAPQWLLGSFVRSVRAVGATAGREAVEAVGQRLLERWQSPDREFHDVRHLMDVLARVEELSQETQAPAVVRLAAWYHGAVFTAARQHVYARRSGEDKQASATLARDELTALGVPAPAAGRVGQLVAAITGHDADPRDGDALALCDADLGVLAVEPQRYAAYRRAVRAEYSHIPTADYLAARIEVLQRLLRRRRIFASTLTAAWEEPARQNLSAELSRLRDELTALEEPESGAVAGAEAGAGAGTGAGTSARSTTSTGAAADAATAVPAPSSGGQHLPAGTPSSHSSAASAAPAVQAGTSADSGGPPRHGIEREPELYRAPERRKRSRREQKRTAQPKSGDSTGSLFRPPPKMPGP